MRRTTTKPRRQRPRAASSSATPALVPQPHGGALLSGGLPGHAGGPGRPKDEIRARLREIAYGKGLTFLDELLDGRISVRLVGRCSQCGNEQAPDPDFVRALLERIEASVDQRLKANEQALRFGVGTQTERISPEEAKERLVRVLQAFARHALDQWKHSRAEVEAALKDMQAAWEAEGRAA